VSSSPSTSWYVSMVYELGVLVLAESCPCNSRIRLGRCVRPCIYMHGRSNRLYRENKSNIEKNYRARYVPLAIYLLLRFVVCVWSCELTTDKGNCVPVFPW
jgi:hypothetical protein